MTGLKNVIFESPNFDPLLWLRFLDDIFCIWTQGLHKLNEYIAFLNDLDPSIKFTMDYSYDRIGFLDITSYNNKNPLCTNLFKNKLILIGSCMLNLTTKIRASDQYHTNKQFALNKFVQVMKS